jgi:hypothetical protein
MSSHGAAQEHALLVAVLERLVAITKHPVWPGFAPATMPLAIAIIDAESTWRTSPSPDTIASAQSTAKVPGSQTMLRSPGIDPRIVANFVADFDGIPTATVIVPAGAVPNGADTGWNEIAGLAAHELFHVYQAENGFAPGGNEAVLLTAPWDDPEGLALAWAEWTALRRAVSSREDERAYAALPDAVALRRERAAHLPEEMLEYIRATEFKEGTARYVQARARRDDPSDYASWMSEQSLDLRRKCYDSRLAWCLLLDRFGPPEWKATVSSSPGTSLDEMAVSLAGGRATEAAGSWRDLIPSTGDNIERERAHRDQRLSSLRSPKRGHAVVRPAPGLDLVVAGFDPINVSVCDAATVVHERYLALAAGDASLTMLDMAAITTSNGDHPLFAGLREAEICGSEEGAGVWLDPRLRIEGDHRVAERADGTLIIELGTPPGGSREDLPDSP